jgi:hypothetical protein
MAHSCIPYRNSLALSDTDIDAFRKEIDETSEDVASTVTALILEGVSPYGIVFGLMKVAAFVAKMTGCPIEVFTKLATVAYNANSKVPGVDVDKLSRQVKPKGPPN